MRLLIGIILLGAALFPGTAAQAQAPDAQRREMWLARLYGGLALQGTSGQYAPAGLAYGGLVGHRIGRRTVLRIDVSRTRFVARCASGGCVVRAATDTQADLFLGGGMELALDPKTVFMRASFGGVHRAGTALDGRGWSLAPAAGVGLRFSSLIALEASVIPVLGASNAERWRFLIALMVGPG